LTQHVRILWVCGHKSGTCQSLVIAKVRRVVRKTFVFAKLFFHADNFTTRCVGMKMRAKAHGPSHDWLFVDPPGNRE